MSRYILQPHVLPELEEIWEYIRGFNEAAAWRVVDAAFETFQTLAESPFIGVKFSGRKPGGIRFLPITQFPTYLVFYRPQEDFVEILHVLHGARDLVKLVR